MRKIECLLIQNKGDGSLGDYLTFSSDTNITEISNLSYNVEKELTKVSPGNITLSVVDFDDSIWTFIKDNLDISSSSWNGLLPPFLVVNVDSEKRFVGIINPSGIKIDKSTKKITIQAIDWSVMLSKIYLDWVRDPAKKTQHRAADVTKSCISDMKILLYIFYRNGDPDHAGGRVYIDTPNNSIIKGDLVTCSLTGSTTYKVLDIKNVQFEYAPNQFWNKVMLQLEGFSWPDPGGDLFYWTAHRWEYFGASITRIASEVTEVNGYVVQTAYTYNSDSPMYALKLDTTDGLVPGDKLDLRSSATRTSRTTFTVFDVDYENSEVVFLDPISVSLSVNDTLYLSDESASELVFESATKLITKACDFFNVTVDKFIAPTLSVPVFAYLPYNSKTSSTDIISPIDIQPNLTGFDIKGAGTLSWTGNFTNGFTTSTWSEKVIWTNQLTSAPATLMLDETKTYAKQSRYRNRTYLNWKARNVDNGGETYEPSTYPKCFLVHDYSGSRRIRVENTTSTHTYKVDTWNGTSWSLGSSQNWPKASPPVSGVAFPSIGSSLGSGASILVVNVAGQLEIALGTSNPTALTLDADQAQGILTSTPYGTYLVGPNGYGKVTYSAGALHLDWIGIGTTTGSEICTLFPNTFVAYDSSNIYCFGSIQKKDDKSTDEVKMLHSTYLYTLPASPNPSSPPVLDEYAGTIEWIADGVFRQTAAVRGPSGKIYGLLGGRLFQIDTTMPDTIERCKPSGMTALELIEHICQIQNAMAVPNPKGYLEIISRKFSSVSATDLTVDQKSIEESRTDDAFFSIIRVGGKEDKVYADVFGLDGGDYLEMDSHPMIFSVSQARGSAYSLLDFFGHPRRAQKQTWFTTDFTQKPAFENLSPLQVITINNDLTSSWIVKSLSINFKDRTAEVQLLENI